MMGMRINWKYSAIVAKMVVSNTASTSGSGSLPGNTVTNPKEDLKGITTRSGVTTQGPTIPLPLLFNESVIRGHKRDTMPPVQRKHQEVTPVVQSNLEFKFPSRCLNPLGLKECQSILREETMKTAVKKLTNKLRNSMKSSKI
ncbi:hypothetical protein Tco_0265192 [Tanacetum coccineum]